MNHETARRIAFAYVGRGICRISNGNFRAVGKAGLFETKIDPFPASTFYIHEINKPIEEILVQSQSPYMLDNQEWIHVSIDSEYAWEAYDFSVEAEQYREVLKDGAILTNAGNMYIVNKDATICVKKKTNLMESYFIPFDMTKGHIANIQNEGKLITIIKTDLGIFANSRFISSIVSAANLLSHEKVKMSEDLAEFINSSIEITGAWELYNMGFESTFMIHNDKMTIMDADNEILYELDIPIKDLECKFVMSVYYWSLLMPKKIQIPKSKAPVLYCRDINGNFAAIAPRKWWAD